MKYGVRSTIIRFVIIVMAHSLSDDISKQPRPYRRAVPITKGMVRLSPAYVKGPVVFSDGPFRRVAQGPRYRLTITSLNRSRVRKNFTEWKSWNIFSRLRLLKIWAGFRCAGAVI